MRPRRSGSPLAAPALDVHGHRVLADAGVRPLVADDAATESGTSREHIIIEDPRNITFVAGGKYTTYRLMGQQTVETALKNFSLEERMKFSQNNTKVPLNSLASPSNLERARAMIQR